MWVKNEIKGQGVKRMNNGQIEIGGNFENGTVSGKGFKKWKNGGQICVYRGDLLES